MQILVIFATIIGIVLSKGDINSSYLIDKNYILEDAT